MALPNSVSLYCLIWYFLFCLTLKAHASLNDLMECGNATLHERFPNISLNLSNLNLNIYTQF